MDASSSNTNNRGAALSPFREISGGATVSNWSKPVVKHEEPSSPVLASSLNANHPDLGTSKKQPTAEISVKQPSIPDATVEEQENAAAPAAEVGLVPVKPGDFYTFSPEVYESFVQGLLKGRSTFHVNGETIQVCLARGRDGSSPVRDEDGNTVVHVIGNDSKQSSKLAINSDFTFAVVDRAYLRYRGRGEPDIKRYFGKELSATCHLDVVPFLHGTNYWDSDRRLALENQHSFSAEVARICATDGSTQELAERRVRAFRLIEKFRNKSGRLTTKQESDDDDDDDKERKSAVTARSSGQQQGAMMTQPASDNADRKLSAGTVAVKKEPSGGGGGGKLAARALEQARTATQSGSTDWKETVKSEFKDFSRKVYAALGENFPAVQVWATVTNATKSDIDSATESLSLSEVLATYTLELQKALHKKKMDEGICAVAGVYDEYKSETTEVPNAAASNSGEATGKAAAPGESAASAIALDAD